MFIHYPLYYLLRVSKLDIVQEVACFSKWKGPSPGAGPGYEEEIAERHISPPLESYSFKPLGKGQVSRPSVLGGKSPLRRSCQRQTERQCLAVQPHEGWKARTNSFSARQKKKKERRQPAQEKPPLTTQSCSDLGPGRGGESKSLSCSLPPETGERGVGGQRGGGLSLGHGLGLAVCSGRFMPIANRCHSQEEGGGQGIMTQVVLGWYSL